MQLFSHPSHVTDPAAMPPCSRATTNAVLSAAQPLLRCGERRCAGPLCRARPAWAATLTCERRHTATITTTTTITAATTAATTSRPPPRLVMDLGNGLTAEVPVMERPHSRLPQRRHRRHPPLDGGHSSSSSSSDTTGGGVAAVVVSPAASTAATVEAAVARLDCSTVADALSRTAHVRIDDVRENFEEVRTRSLPLLLMQQPHRNAVDSADTISPPEAPAGALEAAAVASVLAHLRWVAAASRVDGRRHVAALSPEVVAALWDRVLPRLHERHAATPASSHHHPPPRATYVALRRALAERTQLIAPLLPPPALALVLTRMHQCGALADDVLGAIVAHHTNNNSSSSSSGGGDSIATLQHRVLRLPDNDGGRGGGGGGDAATSGAFAGATALTLARLLGRAAVPGHHQLHRFFHITLLPEVTRALASAAAGASAWVDANAATSAAAAATESLPSSVALLDLTAALRHYAVSGNAVLHLTTLWTAHLTLRHQQLLLASSSSSSSTSRATEGAAAMLMEGAAVLSAVSTVPTASSRTQRRHARVSRHGAQLTAMQQRRRVMHVAESDYLPLVDEVCLHVRRACHELRRPATLDGDNNNGGGAVVAAAPLPAASQLLSLLRLLLRVDSPRWAETYDAVASVTLASLTAAVEAGGAEQDAVLDAVLPVAEVRRTLHALLHRNSLIPDHALHRVLLRRLLHAPAALTDAAAASQALLALDRMTAAQDDAGADSASTAAAATTTAVEVAAAAPLSDAITVADRHRALQVLRRLGRSITPTAFVAGLCVVPLDGLPHTTQLSMMNYFTSVASAIAPATLVKGIDAVVRRLPPSVVDDVSVQRLLSRFTARDVVRRVDVVGCAVLLDTLSASERYQRNCALAKSCLVRRLGAALRRTGDDGDSAAVTLDELPRVVGALQRAHVLLPPYLSRVCRLLLGEVERAPLAELLPPFAVVADAYMSRQRSEAQASTFRDVWELLRGRVVEEAARLTPPSTVTALNAFAALDVADQSLFSVLTHHLWVCLRQREADVLSTAAAAAAHGGDGGAATLIDVTVDDGSGDDAAAAEVSVRRRAQAADHVLATLSPSAVAAVTATLLRRASLSSENSPNDNNSGGGGDVVRAMLPWMLIALRRTHAELYPVDVVHVLPALLERHAGDAVLLHGAYDACRHTFLRMFALLPDTVAAMEEPALLSAEEVERCVAERAQWSPATRLSVEVVPRVWFAAVLISLGNAAVDDPAVALACARRACTRRVCGEQLSAAQLVDLCLALCSLASSFSTVAAGGVSATHSPTPNSSASAAAAAAGTCATADGGGDDSHVAVVSPAALPSPADVLRAAMATVLSALWQRSDELMERQIHALLRCLRATYGADKVDRDFVSRLEAQVALLQQQQQQQQRQQRQQRQQQPSPSTAGMSVCEDRSSCTPTPAPQEHRAPVMSAEDLFDIS